MEGSRKEQIILSVRQLLHVRLVHSTNTGPEENLPGNPKPAGYLDALLHGLFGLSSPNPGFENLRIEPLFPESWEYTDLGLHLPSGTRLNLKYKSDNEILTIENI